MRSRGSRVEALIAMPGFPGSVVGCRRGSSSVRHCKESSVLVKFVVNMEKSLPSFLGNVIM